MTWNKALRYRGSSRGEFSWESKKAPLGVSEKMHLNKTVVLAVGLMALTLSPRNAVAEPEFLDTLTAHYHIKDNTPLSDKSCGICHVSEEDYKFNPYGKQLTSYLTDHNLKKVDDAVLDAVDKLSATNDGV